jgi:hypothetical protein
MGKLTFGERHIINALPPVADAFAGTVYSDVIKVSDYHAARFTLYRGVGATGTSTLTIEACDDAAGTNPVAIPFAYQKYDNADDVPDDVVQATAAGFTTGAGSNFQFVLEAETQRMGDKKWLRLKAVEVVDSPVLGGIMVTLLHPRYARQVPPTAIA